MYTLSPSVLKELSGSFPSTLFSSEPEYVEKLQENTSEFASRNVIGVFSPIQPETVSEIVRAAGKFGFCLYPYSTGKNWGLGSRLPVTDDCALLDLGGMKKIREVNTELHYAIIEPGVTQRQLSDYLKENNLPFFLNITGSSPDSSIIGNLLERGTGFYSHKVEDMRGLEIVKADGEVLRTGFWHYEKGNRPIHHYKYGIGPYLDGLFTQSNFGIVTAAVVSLIPQPEKVEVMWCTFHNEHLSQAIAIISRLYHQNLLHNVLHIGNSARLKITGAEELVWSMWGAISGNANLVNFLKGEITRQLQEIPGTTQFLSDEDVKDNEHYKTLYGMYLGIPSDMFLNAMYKSVGQDISAEELDLDVGRYGMLCCLPMLPMEGRHIDEAVKLVHTICSKFNIIPAVTVNPMSGEYAESVINIYFDRSSEDAITTAQRCNMELHKQLFEDGYRFYRVDIESMRKITKEDSTFWRTVSEIKKALDPQGILSPGRYCPL